MRRQTRILSISIKRKRDHTTSVKHLENERGKTNYTKFKIKERIRKFTLFVKNLSVTENTYVMSNYHPYS